MSIIKGFLNLFKKKRNDNFYKSAIVSQSIIEEQKPKPNTISVKEAMAMPRAARRALGKLNSVKIPGSNKPYVKS